MKEEWKNIPGFPRHIVSSTGRVAKILKNSNKHHTGYWKTSLCHNGVRVQPFVHQVVALAFHGTTDLKDPVVHHKNGDRGDNRPENLEWTTRGANARLGNAKRWARAIQTAP